MLVVRFDRFGCVNVEVGRQEGRVVGEETVMGVFVVGDPREQILENGVGPRESFAARDLVVVEDEERDVKGEGRHVNEVRV